MYSDTTEDMHTQLYLAAFIPDIDDRAYSDNFTLKLFIDEIPQGFNFSIGNRSGNRVVLERGDFGDVWMMPKKDFSGLVRLNITAIATTPLETKFASSHIEIKITAIADVPFLNVNVPCYHWNSSEQIIPVFHESHLNDQDGSENLTIVFSGLPSGYRLIHEDNAMFVNGSNYTAPQNSSGWFILFNGTLKPFIFNVTAIAEERSHRSKANMTATVDVAFCGKFNNFIVLMAKKWFSLG